jgi:hypothetical protein
VKILRLFLPGQFEDVQLYMGHLVAFTTERDARLIELESFCNEVGNLYPEWKGRAVFAFARNDWLGSSQFQTLMDSPQMNVTFRRRINRLAKNTLEVTPPYDGTLGRFDLDADVLLDTHFYGRRLYAATERGLFDFDIDWQTLVAVRSRKRHDGRCVSASALYGAINASCESDGLFTGYDEFGWQSGNGVTHSLTQTAPRSLRTSWFGHDLVNYKSAGHAELLRSSVERVEDESEGGGAPRQRELVTALGGQRRNLDFVLTTIGREHGVELDDVQYMWNSSTSFFINTYSHGFFTAFLRSDGDVKEVRTRKHDEVPGRVVAVNTTPRGWTIETDYRLLLYTKNELIPLIEEEALSVRTFAGSKRYRNLVAVTVETGVYLLSLVET